MNGEKPEFGLANIVIENEDGTFTEFTSDTLELTPIEESFGEIEIMPLEKTERNPNNFYFETAMVSIDGGKPTEVHDLEITPIADPTEEDKAAYETMKRVIEDGSGLLRIDKRKKEGEEE